MSKFISGDIILTRFGTIPGVGCYGRLDYSFHDLSVGHVLTVEAPWVNNTPNISCIPTGTYQLLPHPFDENKIRLISSALDVYMQASDSEYIRAKMGGLIARWGINIEIANVPSQIEGCIALGTKHDVLSIKGHRPQLGVWGARVAIEEFIGYLDKEKLSNGEYSIIIE